MKNLPLIAAVVVIGSALSGCSLFHHHQPKSSFKIIEAGDPNPNIIETPEVIRQTPTTTVTVESQPVNN